MISMTRLLGGSFSFDDPSCDAFAENAARRTVAAPGPTVMWLATRTCNLDCSHCHAEAARQRFTGELTTDEAKAMIDDLASISARALVMTGGEPLLRADVPSLLEHASRKGIPTILSTNGTLIDPAMARRLAETGLDSIRISVDGAEPTHDRFRGRRGAWRKTLHGIRNAREKGIRVTVRFTVTGDNVEELGDIYRVVEDEGISHLVIQHLVYAGSDSFLAGIDLDIWEKREMMDVLLRRTDEWITEGRSIEVHTADNHCDAPFVYLWLLGNDPDRANDAGQMLQRLRGNRAGETLAAIDNVGGVSPDLFLRNHSLGNIRERKFSEIWSDTNLPILRDLKRRRELLHGRCADCSWLDVCNASSRARAEAESSGDVWASDPGCYLLDEEISSNESPHAMAAT